MSIAAAVLNMGVFLDHPTAKPIVKALGRTGARIFYALLGAVFLVIGVFCTHRALQLMGVLGGAEAF
jgi:hypothetical protein